VDAVAPLVEFFFFTVGISLERMILQLSIFLSGVNAFERIWFVLGKKES
jgi:hypothetical protein